MAKTTIPLLDAKELERLEGYYAKRHDLDARTILRLLNDCRYYRGWFDTQAFAESIVAASASQLRITELESLLAEQDAQLAQQRRALTHVADEIEGQVRVGHLKDASHSTRIYYRQLASVARDPSILAPLSRKEDQT